MGRKTQPLFVLGIVLSVLGLASLGMGAQRMLRGNSDVVKVDATVQSASAVTTSMVVGARGARRDIEQRELHFAYRLDGNDTQGTKRVGVAQQKQHFTVGSKTSVWVDRQTPAVVMLKMPSPFFALFILGVGALLFLCGLGFVLFSTLTKG